MTTAAGIGAGLLTGGMSVPAQLGIEAAASGGGDYAYQLFRQLLGGEPANPMESAEVAGSSLAFGAGGRALAGMSRAVAGIPKNLAAEARGVKGLAKTFGAPSPTAELELGQKIQAAVGRMKNKISAGRQVKEAMIQSSDASGKTFDIASVIERLRSGVIEGATEPSAMAANRKLARFADSLEKRGPLTAGQLDALMTKELAPAAYTNTGAAASNRLAGPYRSAREAAKNIMESQMGPELAAANRAAEHEIVTGRVAGKVFGPSKLSLEAKLRNLFKPGHEKEQQILREIGADAGVDFLAAAKRIATKRAFTKDLAIAGRLDNLLSQLPRMLFGPFSKGLVPLGQYAGPLAGGAAAGFEEERQVSEEENP